MPQINLAIGQMSLEGDATSKDDTVTALLYNGYRVKRPDGSAPIYGIWGLKSYINLGTNAPIDGDYYSTIHNIRVVVSNGRVFTVSGGIATEKTGANLTAATPVSFVQDKDAIYFAAKSPINKLQGGAITQLGAQAPINVTCLNWLKGFMLAVGDDPLGGGVAGDTWYSDDTGYATWEVYNNEYSPDALQSQVVIGNDVYSIGVETTEMSYLSTDPSAPFLTNTGGIQSFGTRAPYAVAFDKQSIYFPAMIGENIRIVRLVGGRDPQIISFPVDVSIDKVADISSAIGKIVGFAGQTFYMLTIPNASITIDDQVHDSITLAFNIRNEEWYIWGEYDNLTGHYKRHPGNTFCFIEPEGKRYMGGIDGIIYELDKDTMTTGATATRTALRLGWRSWGKLKKRKFCNSYSYDLKRGGDLNTEEHVMIHRWRNDGSLEWNNGREIYLGAPGSRKTPVTIRRCGAYYKRQDEFIFSYPSEVVFNGIEEDFELEN